MLKSKTRFNQCFWGSIREKRTVKHTTVQKNNLAKDMFFKSKEISV